ncbi:MAG: type VI secretion system protein ImpL [Deltaproteobacteria bacterium]|nr:MAG: type VI secretion system protein ImpL [Deltaproteobacteria bacterium]
MKQLLGKIAKIILVLGIIFLVFLLVFLLVTSMNWPWWTGGFILLGIVSLFFLFLFLRKIWLRRKEQMFVDQIIAQDNARLKGLDEKEREHSKALQRQWKEAIETLRRSHLRKYGNPLYVLPWYMVIGESGSGKTTAIKAAKLSSPFATMAQTSGISGTKNCDWWFFEQAIILDTAGRYAIPVDEGRDKEEWKKFLNLLRKYRKKEPLNGLIVTISADKLLQADPATLEEDGKSIRRRVDELMLALGTKFPVYILVTKCDLIQGMTQFCEHLPESALSQAMGLVNRDFSKDAISFLGQAMDTIAENLRDMRLLLLEKSERPIDPGLLLFPEEFENVQGGLKAFVQGAFQENPYQETPLLRGLYFSSGKQEGTPYSHFLNALGLIEEKQILPGTNKGLFLHDLFAKVLPRDRGLFAPTQRAIEWSRLTRNLGLVAWVTFVIAICGLLSFSFVKNLNIIRQASQEFSKSPVLKGEVVSDVVTLDRFREAILAMEAQNKDWWLPRFGLTESQSVERELKKKFSVRFKKAFLDPLDKMLVERLADFSAQTPPDVMGMHMALLVRRVNLLKARMKGQGIEALMAMPEPPYEALIQSPDKKILPEIEKKLAGLYLYYLVWSQDSAALNTELSTFQKWLGHLVKLEGANLKWLIPWVNSQESLSPVNVKDYWKGSGELSKTQAIQPAFTHAGKQFIQSFLKEMETALPDPGPPLIAKQKMSFESWYNKEYLEKWKVFCLHFPNGSQALKGKEEWQRMAAKVARGKGPFASLLARLPSELEGFANLEITPPWVTLVYKLQEVKTEAKRVESLKEKSSLAKVTKKGRKLITRVERAFTRSGKGKSVGEQMAAAKAYLSFKKALSNLVPITVSRKTAFEKVTQVFKEDPAESSSPFVAAHKAILDLKTYMGEQTKGEKPFWTVFAGPFRFMWKYARVEAGCHLQSLWEKKVLVEIQDVQDQKTLNQLLLGKGGLATSFAKIDAGPFLSRSLKKGYYAVRALGGTIPFEPAFLRFLTKGAAASRPVRQTYTVRITALPVDTNPEASIKPHATHLKIQCSDKTKRIDNFQYPVRKTITWSPASCGDVVLQIDVANLKLVKKYTDYNAFAKFLMDFRSGQKVFKPSDFPEDEAALKRLGIRFIRVNYQFKGHRPILRLLARSPKRVPNKITQCWD